VVSGAYSEEAAVVARKYVNPNRPGAWDQLSRPPGSMTPQEMASFHGQRGTRFRAAAEGDDSEDLCKTCGGTGRLKHPSTGKLSKQCPSCEGSGVAPDESQAGAGNAPGAQLDSFPWARSWGSFLAAISDEGDELGAQAACARVMDELTRPRGAMSERVPAEGGFLVPEYLRQDVLSYLLTGVVWPRATIIPMTTLRMPVPVIDSPSQQSSVQPLGMNFAWLQEGHAFPSVTPDFGRLSLNAWKTGGMLQVPNELVGDSAPFSDVFLGKVVGEGLSWFLDDNFLGGTATGTGGTGVGQPQSLVNAPGGLAVTRNTGSKVLHLDIVAMLKGLHPASKAKATWLLSESAFDQLLELYETVGTAPTGQDIAPPQTLVYDEAAGTWKLLGIPAVVTDHQAAVGSAGDVILADLSLFLVGDRQMLTIERSQQGPGYLNDLSYFRLRARVDGRFWPQSVITLATGQQVSGLVVLH
jgi:HK97 family phage major capsid protein